MSSWAKQKGFTIVELLVVIVVVAILAAISVVAYTGIQDRAKYTEALSNLKSIDKAIGLYHAQNGYYPIVTTWSYYCSYQSTPSDFIPGLDEVVESIPAAPCTGATNSDDTWLYKSDVTGDNYKLLYLRANVSSGFRNLVPVDMRDVRWVSGTTWGYWTSAYAAI